MATLRSACEHCRARKTKCDGKHPCTRCVDSGVPDECWYLEVAKPGRPKKRPRLNLPANLEHNAPRETNDPSNLDPLSFVATRVGLTLEKAKEYMQEAMTQITMAGAKSALIPCSVAKDNNMDDPDLDPVQKHAGVARYLADLRHKHVDCDHSHHRHPNACRVVTAVFLVSGVRASLWRDVARQCSENRGQVSTAEQQQVVSKLMKEENAEFIVAGSTSDVSEKLSQLIIQEMSLFLANFHALPPTAVTSLAVLTEFVGWKQRHVEMFISNAVQRIGDAIDTHDNTPAPKSNPAFLRVRQALMLMNKHPFIISQRGQHDLLDRIVPLLFAEVPTEGPQPPPSLEFITNATIESLVWQHVSSRLVIRSELNKLFASLYRTSGTLNPLDLTCTIDIGSLILGVLDKIDLLVAEGSPVAKRMQHCPLFYSPFRAEVSLFVRGMVLSALNFQHSHALTASKLWERLNDFAALSEKVPLHNFIALVDVMHFIICALCRDGNISQAKEALYLQGHLVAFFPAGQTILADGIRCIKDAEARSISPSPVVLPNFIPDLFVPFVTDFASARNATTRESFLSMWAPPNASAAAAAAAASVARAGVPDKCPAHQTEGGDDDDTDTPPFLFSADLFMPPAP